jgi:hypothetical protein
MIMNPKILVVGMILLMLMACSNSSEKLIPLDLLSHGMSLKINGPEEPEVVFDDIGLIKEMTIKGNEDHFNIVITSSETDMMDIPKLVEDEKKDIESSMYFSKIVSEDEKGFIYEKMISEDYINYDFRHIKIQGETKYVFKSGLGMQYSLDDVELMYKAIQ